jgi:hypothetical protein
VVATVDVLIFRRMWTFLYYYFNVMFYALDLIQKLNQNRMCFDQPSATHPHFGQTCLFTNFPNISTTVRGSKFQGIREKVGLSKMGVSCRRLDVLGFLGCYDLL